MNKEEIDEILNEAMALLDKGISPDYERVGFLHNGDKVDQLVWMSLRAMVIGLGTATKRDFDRSQQRKTGTI